MERPPQVWTGNKEDDRLSSRRSARREPSEAIQPSVATAARRGSSGSSQSRRSRARSLPVRRITLHPTRLFIAMSNESDDVKRSMARRKATENPRRKRPSQGFRESRHRGPDRIPRRGGTPQGEGRRLHFRRRRHPVGAKVTRPIDRRLMSR